MARFELEDRCLKFAIRVRRLIKLLPRNVINIEDGKQVVRSSGSVGANYIEANENLGEKDFKMRLRIARKEARESGYWLKIIKEMNVNDSNEIANLIDEAEQLNKILSSIINLSLIHI